MCIMKYLKYDSKRALIKIYKLLYNNTTCYMNRKFLKWKDFLGSLEEKSSKEKQGEPIKQGVFNIVLLNANGRS